jgi:copper chaperone CopZ
MRPAILLPWLLIRQEKSMNEATTYHVPDVGSGHCSAAIVEEVALVEGVERVTVDLRAKLAQVTGRGVDTSAVVAAIYTAGYEAVIT